MPSLQLQPGETVFQLLRRRSAPVGGTNSKNNQAAPLSANSVSTPVADTALPYKRFGSASKSNPADQQIKSEKEATRKLVGLASYGFDRSAVFRGTAAGHPGGWIPIFSDSRRSHREALGHHYRRGPNIIGMHFFTAALRALEPRIDDDFIDRLNYYYSSTMIIMFAILVSAKQYVGHPIECWVPAQFTKAMEQYAENYCWIQNTYWVPFSDLIPNRWEDRERRQIGYYQWVPFILALEALLFYVPAIIWRLMNTQSGINTMGVLQMASDEHNIEPENRIRTVNILSRYLDDALRYQRDFGTKEKYIYLWAFIRVGKFYGAYVSLLYIFVKFLYCVNVLGQFFLLNRFLETSDYPFFGAHVLWDLLNGADWQHSGKFPRVTLCDFDIRVVGNIHRHTIQCVLVINMFTEKIFIVLWLWLLFLCFTDVFGLLFWTLTTVAPALRIRFITKYLDLTDAPPDPSKDSAHLRKFVLNFLRPDGVLILRMIASHGGTILCTELIYSLWLRYRETFKLTVEPVDDEDTGESVSSADATSQQASNLEKPSTDTTKATIVKESEETKNAEQQPRSQTPGGIAAPEEETEMQPWAKPPPLPLIGNHRPTMMHALAGGVGKGRFIPERPNHTGTPVDTRASSVAKIGGEEFGSAYV